MSIIKGLYHESVFIADYVKINDVDVGERTKIYSFSNLYGCKIGQDCVIGGNVEIQKDVVIGDRVHVSSHTFICSSVEIGDDTFVGHSCVFINDTFDGNIVHYHPDDWKKTKVGKDVKIGSNATIFPVTIGDGATIGAGAVVTKNVEPNTIVMGNPARVKQKIWE